MIAKHTMENAERSNRLRKATLFLKRVKKKLKTTRTSNVTTKPIISFQLIKSFINVEISAPSFSAYTSAGVKNSPLNWYLIKLPRDTINQKITSIAMREIKIIVG